MRVFGWKKKYQELKDNIKVVIEGLRVGIRTANWNLGFASGKDKDGWQILKNVYINKAKDFSKLINYEWKKEYEEETY